MAKPAKPKAVAFTPRCRVRVHESPCLYGVWINGKFVPLPASTARRLASWLQSYADWLEGK